MAKVYREYNTHLEEQVTLPVDEVKMDTYDSTELNA